MTAIGIPAQPANVGDQAGPNRIQVNIANQFFQIHFLLAHYGLEAVLEQLSMPAMAAVKSDDISGQQPAHQVGQRGTLEITSA